MSNTLRQKFEAPSVGVNRAKSNRSSRKARLNEIKKIYNHERSHAPSPANVMSYGRA